jgi:hypothetical protein
VVIDRSEVKARLTMEDNLRMNPTHTIFVRGFLTLSYCLLMWGVNHLFTVVGDLTNLAGALLSQNN